MAEGVCGKVLAVPVRTERNWDQQTEGHGPTAHGRCPCEEEAGDWVSLIRVSLLRCQIYSIKVIYNMLYIYIYIYTSSKESYLTTNR